MCLGEEQRGGEGSERMKKEEVIGDLLEAYVPNLSLLRRGWRFSWASTSSSVLSLCV